MANEPRKEIIMNATMNNLTATATTSKKFAFTYNHITKKIVGTDVAFAKAGIPGSALEKELLARMEGQPTYTFAVLETEKKPAKQTYKGLRIEVMQAFIIQHEETPEKYNAKLKELNKAMAEGLVKGAKYSAAKSWFLKHYGEVFNGSALSKKEGKQEELIKNLLALAKKNENAPTAATEQ